MWETLRTSPRSDPEFTRSATELAQSAFRQMIFTTGGIYLAWHFLITISWAETLGPRVWSITAILVSTGVLALRLLPRRAWAAQAVWQVGLAAAITIATYQFRQPSIAFCYVLLPFMAVVTTGWPAGLIAEGMIIALVCWLLASPMPPILSPAYAAGIVSGGALAGLVGWSSSRTLYTVTHWSIFSFNQARQNMEEARQHRAQLARVVKDLDQAYYRLERSNASLVAAWRVADEAERFKAEFATNVSHELRTPLNLIVGFSEMMLTAPESYGGAEIPGPYRSDLNAVHHNAQHLLALVDDVLDLARIEAGKIAIVRGPVDLKDLIAEAVDMLTDYVGAKGLELRVHIAPNLPQLWIDRLRIRQVLLNLLVNAARFTEAGWIAVDISQDDAEVLVRVSDTGQGIPQEDLPKIFQEFRSTEQPLSTWHSGTGLGLPISKKFVELHHGRMGVESTYLQGTTFWFTLPIGPLPAQSASESFATTGQLIRPTNMPRPYASERILVVIHDDPHTAALLQRHMDGYQVIGTTDMAEGVALVRELQAVGMIIDIDQTPPSLPRDIPIVRCSLPSGRRAALAMGADELLVKPVSRGELVGAINRLVLGKTIRRVLIADDDPDVVRLFRRMLNQHVQECLEAYNGEEALRLVREEKPDLIILDLIMPELNGQDVLDHLSDDPVLANIPVLLVSARGQDHTSWQLPAPIHLSKSEGFELGELIRTLEAVFGTLSPGWG